MKNIPVLTITLAFLSACSTGITIGSRENTANPPKLVKTADGGVHWENVSSFGPVPKDKLEKYDQICTSVNPNWYVGGYNSKAINLDGKAFPDGGFICLSK